ncbi:hypothetical protein [Geobacter sulfurreducens]|uniref:hypothetical protein n=1 Tax=Geobacter sulfurreducens TaxID=35554 RepID=UPI000DBB7957|nr:hypothetical protein [Geobacter sulfurreducens]BBA70044.1 hypothetical protein YM18_1509 [Geobacter sulfurreducens]
MTDDRKKIKLGELLLPKDVVVRFNEQYKMSEELDEKLKELAELARKNKERAKSADEHQLRLMYTESIEQIIPAISEGVKTIKSINDLAVDLQKKYAVSITSTSKYNKIALTIAAVTLISTLFVSVRSCQVAVDASNSSERQLNRITSILDASLANQARMKEDISKISTLPPPRPAQKPAGQSRPH